MRRAHFRVFGQFDGEREATVTIDLGADLFLVRPLRRKRTYVLKFSHVAEMVLWRVLKADLAEKKRAKLAKRKKGNVR